MSTADIQSVVAERGDLPGLPAQLRRRQRRRHRRPRRRPVPPATTWPPSASTRSGSAPGTPRRWPTPATTSSDYRDIDPVFGTLAEAEALIAEAHALGIRIIIDIVPNHCSDAAPLVPGRARRRARAPERDLFWFRPGRGPDGDLPPTDWVSTSAARPGPGPPTRTARRATGTCTCSRPSSPTSTGTTRGCATSSRTSCGSGSTAAWTASGSTRPRCWSRTRAARGRPRTRRSPHHRPRRGARHLPALAADRRRVPRRAGADRRGVAAGPRSGSPTTCARTSCTPRSTSTSSAAPGTPAALRGVHRRHAARARAGRRAGHLGAVQPRRDPARHPVRPGGHVVQLRRQARGDARPTWSSGARGPGRQRCSAWRCPASAYVYQGEELGLWEVEDIPHELRQDPMWPRSGRVDPGRDGCRVPMPWAGVEAPFGFSPAGAPRRRGCRSRPTGRTGPSRRRPATRTRCSSSTAMRCGSGTTEPALGDGAAALAAAHRRACWRSPAATASPAWSTSPPRRCRCRRTTSVLLGQRAARRRPAAARHRGLAPPALTSDRQARTTRRRPPETEAPIRTHRSHHGEFGRPHGRSRTREQTTHGRLDSHQTSSGHHRTDQNRPGLPGHHRVGRVAAATAVADQRHRRRPRAAPAALSPVGIPGRGATVPFVEQEAEDVAHNGTVIGPDRVYGQLPSEASGRRGGHPRRGRRVRRVHPHQAGQRDRRSATACRTTPPAPAGTPPVDLRVNGTKLKDRPGHLEVRLVLRRLSVQQQPGRHQPAPLLRRGAGDVRLHPAGRHQGPGPGRLHRAVAHVHDRPGRLRAGRRPDRPAGQRARRRSTDFGADPSGATDSTADVPGRGRRRPGAGPGGVRPAGQLHPLRPRHRRRGDAARRRPLVHRARRAAPHPAQPGRRHLRQVRQPGRPSQNVTLQDFAIIGDITERVDDDQVNAIGGAMSDSVVDNVWMQHTKVGAWMDGPMDNFTITQQPDPGPDRRRRELPHRRHQLHGDQHVRPQHR